MDIEFPVPDSTATGCWVVVADGARARLFEVHRAAPGLRSLLGYELTGNRLPSHERWSDRAGQSHERSGHGVHRMNASTDPVEHEHDRLAELVAKILRQGRVEGHCRAIVLVAPPAFLGKLRRELDDPTRLLVIDEDHRDLSRLPEHELETRIDTAAWPSGGPPQRRMLGR